MILEIQLITDERFSIPGTGEVTIFGRILRIGPGEFARKFPYRSPEAQIAMYGQQHFVLINVENDEGEAIDHPDLMRRVNVDTNEDELADIILDKDAETEPIGVHPSITKYGWGNDQIDEKVLQVTSLPEPVVEVEEETEPEPAPKRKRKVYKKGSKLRDKLDKFKRKSKK